MSRPTPQQPSEIDCPECDAKGCDECEHGRFLLTDCPYEFIDHQTREALQLADFAEHGLPPVAGGALDQESTFMQAWQQIRADQAKLRDLELKRLQQARR